jgi:hypothetical protein
MGYISPVTQYEYIQYTNRTIAAEKLAKDTITRFKPVQPIKFHRKDEERSLQEGEIGTDDYQFSSNRMFKKYVPMDVVEKTATEVTGIGQFVNESI